MSRVRWIVCEPYDRESRAMMNYILATCQELKGWVTDRRKDGGLKPGGDVEKKKEEWLRDYLSRHKGSNDVPRFSLVHSLNQVWELKRMQELENMREWESFSVEARPGWSKRVTRKRKKIEYEDWLSGMVNQASSPRVTADKAIEQLFDEKVISFRWGKVAFDEGGVMSIKRQRLEEEAVDYKEFFERIERLTFKRQLQESGKDKWFVSIVLAPKVELTQEGEEEDAEDSLYQEEVRSSSFGEDRPA